MELDSSSEAASSSAFPQHDLESKIVILVYKTPSLADILIQVSPFHTTHAVILPSMLISFHLPEYL
jgi:hypothetical protein